MGRKPSGTRKPIHLCVALLIFLIPLACALSQPMETKITDTTGQEARAHLTLGRKLLAQGEYAQALRENEKVLSLAGRDIPRDESLFSIGLIHAHPANPARDYGKSLASFRRLLKDYPGSPLEEQARILTGLLQENEKLDRTVERLDRTVERLNTVINELKKVDIGVDQKKRESGR
jgi:tetratricopeptide (TPR) repeat protein